MLTADWPALTSAYSAAPTGTPVGRERLAAGDTRRRGTLGRPGPRRPAAAGGPPGRPPLRVPPRQAAERPRQSRPAQTLRDLTRPDPVAPELFARAIHKRKDNA